MGEVRFHLLGPFEAWLGDRAVPSTSWRTRQTLAVLKLLLGERGRVVPFERLTDAVWPDADPDAARTSLRGAIRTVRRVLEPELAAGSASHHVRTEREGYRFVTHGAVLDVDAFEAACGSGVAAEARGDTTTALRAYREAAVLYRGDYLSDDPYADWALEARERLRNAHLDALEGLATLLTDAGEHGQAMIHLDRALALDPLREELHRQLMRCHAGAGRRSHMLAAFERCRRLLERELGVEPEPATQRLREELAAGGALRPGSRGASTGEPDAVFVGRAAELAVLGQAWARSRLEGSGMALVSGSAGEGKTRLARQFIERGGPQPATLWLAGHEGEGELPFAPLITPLANWLDRSATGAQIATLGPYAPVLAGLLPQVRARWPACPPASGAPEQGQVLEALTQALPLSLGRKPAVIVFDDLHWADPSTVTWLGYALRRLPPGTFVVATARSGEARRPSLAGLLSDLRRAERLTEVELGSLAQADVHRWLALLRPPGEVVAPLADALHTATGGNALYLVETLRELDRSDGWGAAGAQAELPVPASAREAIRARVGRLEPPAREVLEAAAVVGAPARASLLAALLRWQLEAALDVLDTLLLLRLLRTTEDGQAYVVEHPLVARIVYDDLGPGRRQRWHLRAAAALESRHADNAQGAPAQVLRHLLAGDAATDEVVRVAIAAGEQALRQHAYGEALECFDAARTRLSPRRPGTDAGAELAGVTEQWAETLHRIGRSDDALAGYELVLAMSEDAIDRCRLRRKMAQVLGDAGATGLERALELLDEADRELPEDGAAPARAERGRVETTRSLTHFHRSDFRAAVACAERARSLLEGLPGAERDVNEQLYLMGTAEQRLGLLREAEARYRAVVARARVMADPLAEARYSEGLALVLLHRGRLRQALEMIESDIGTFHRLGLSRFEAIGLGNRGYALDHLGDLTGARAAYEDALGLAEALRSLYTIVHNRVGLGEVLVRLGGFALARASLESAIELGNEIGTRQRVGHAYLYLADLALHEGDPERGTSLAERGVAEGEAIGDWHALRVGKPILARCLLGLGRTAEAEAAARRGLEAAAAGGFVLDQGRNHTALGQALWAAGAGDQAAAALGRAEAIFRGASAGFLLAEVLLLNATAGAGSPDAPAVLREALALARAAGARPLEARILQAVRVSSPPAAAPASHRGRSPGSRPGPAVTKPNRSPGSSSGQ